MSAALAGLALAAPASAAPPPTPVVPVEYVYAPCPDGNEGGRSCTWEGGPIYLAPGFTREDRWHERGHQFDYQRMTDRARARFMRIMRLGSTWRAAPNSPHEQFAEAYMHCALHHRAPFDSTGYGYEPSRRQHPKVCALIRAS